MAGSYTGTQQGSELDLDLLAEELSQQIFGLGEDIPEISLGIAAGGSGVSVFSGDRIHLEQAPHTEVAYEWQPERDCQIELLSSKACVAINDNCDGFRSLDLPGNRATIKAGVSAQFSVITITGSVDLQIHEQF